MNEGDSVKENSVRVRNIYSYVLFGIMAIIFLASGTYLKINIIYSAGAIILLILSLVFRLRFIGFFSLLLFSYAIGEVKMVSLGNIFLFSLGFVSSYMYTLQFSVSQKKEANPLFSCGAGLLLAAPYVLLSALQYKTFSSSLIVSPLGVMLIVFIIIFFRAQYYIWKGK